MGTIAAAAGLFTNGTKSLTRKNPYAGRLSLPRCHAQGFSEDRPQESTDKRRTSLPALQYQGNPWRSSKGFPSVRTVSLPKLRSAFSSGQTENEAYLNTLLTLMANVDDTNVLSRTNMVIQGHVKSEAASSEERRSLHCPWEWRL